MKLYDSSKPYRVWSGEVSHGSYSTISDAFNNLPRGVDMLRVTKVLTRLTTCGRP
jgi:hypothetical protein